MITNVLDTSIEYSTGNISDKAIFGSYNRVYHLGETSWVQWTTGFCVPYFQTDPFVGRFVACPRAVFLASSISRDGYFDLIDPDSTRFGGMNSYGWTAKPNGFADHYPYEKWLAIIGHINPTFSVTNLFWQQGTRILTIEDVYQHGGTQRNGDDQRGHPRNDMCRGPTRHQASL